MGCWRLTRNKWANIPSSPLPSSSSLHYLPSRPHSVSPPVSNLTVSPALPLCAQESPPPPPHSDKTWPMASLRPTGGINRLGHRPALRPSAPLSKRCLELMPRTASSSCLLMENQQKHPESSCNAALKRQPVDVRSQVRLVTGLVSLNMLEFHMERLCCLFVYL